MHPALQSLGKSLPLLFFTALLVATQFDAEGPIQAIAVGVGVCAAGFYGAWAAHFFDYPRRYGRKAVLLAARSLSWLDVAFLLGVLAVFVFAPITGEPRELAQWLMFVVGLMASEISILAYSKQLHSAMAAHQKVADQR